MPAVKPQPAAQPRLHPTGRFWLPCAVFFHRDMTGLYPTRAGWLPLLWRSRHHWPDPGVGSRRRKSPIEYDQHPRIALASHARLHFSRGSMGCRDSIYLRTSLRSIKACHFTWFPVCCCSPRCSSASPYLLPWDQLRCCGYYRASLIGHPPPIVGTNLNLLSRAPNGR